MYCTYTVVICPLSVCVCVCVCVCDLYLTKHKAQTSMPPGGIRTRDPSKRAAADTRLRPRGHWGWHFVCILECIVCLQYIGVL